MIRVIGSTPRNATSALIPIAREDLHKVDKRTTLFVITDVAVVLTPCWCGADYNEPCVGSSGKMTMLTHVDRRLAAHKTRSTLGLDEKLHVAWVLQEHGRTKATKRSRRKK